jgi:hypothetical protein
MGKVIVRNAGRPKPKLKSTQSSGEVSLERDMLLRMAGDQRFLNLLPPLKTLNQKIRQKSKGCGCGAKSKPNLVQGDFEAAKRQIANLATNNPTLQRELKGLLSADSVRIKYLKADASGVVVRKFS